MMEGYPLPKITEPVIRLLGKVANRIIGAGICMIGEINETIIEMDETKRGVTYEY
jgi:hypothetical protein